MIELNIPVSRLSAKLKEAKEALKGICILTAEEVKYILLEKPFPNEHSARLRRPGDFDSETFRRTRGGRIGAITIPRTISIIWAKLKARSGPDDPVIPQALRFPTKDWTVAQAKAWLKENKIKHILFEPATGGRQMAKGINPEVKRVTMRGKPRSVDAANRTITVVMSSDMVDRDGDIIEPKGANFKNFKGNPVVLFGHDMRKPAIGRIDNIEVTENTIEGDIKFADTNLGNELFTLYKDGFMNAWSVGFIPDRSKMERIENEDGDLTGFRIKKWELIELSAVTVGANPEALSKQMKLSSPELRKALGMKEAQKTKVCYFPIDNDQLTLAIDGNLCACLDLSWGKDFTRGAFTKSANESVANGKVRLFARDVHRHIVTEQVGVVEEMKESDEALTFMGKVGLPKDIAFVGCSLEYLPLQREAIEVEPTHGAWRNFVPGAYTEVKLLSVTVFYSQKSTTPEPPTKGRSDAVQDPKGSSKVTPQKGADPREVERNLVQRRHRLKKFKREMEEIRNG